MVGENKKPALLADIQKIIKIMNFFKAKTKTYNIVAYELLVIRC